MGHLLNEDQPGSFRMEGFDMTSLQVQVETSQRALISLASQLNPQTYHFEAYLIM